MEGFPYFPGNSVPHPLLPPVESGDAEDRAGPGPVVYVVPGALVDSLWVPTQTPSSRRVRVSRGVPVPRFLPGRQVLLVSFL